MYNVTIIGYMQMQLISFNDYPPLVPEESYCNCNIRIHVPGFIDLYHCVKKIEDMSLNLAAP